MSVLIRGMDEIPEDGAVLVVKHDNGKAYIKHACTYGYSMELVKIPEKHGRLIDEDDIDIPSLETSYDQVLVYGAKQTHDIIRQGGERNPSLKNRKKPEQRGRTDGKDQSGTGPKKE